MTGHFHCNQTILNFLTPYLQASLPFISMANWFWKLSTTAAVTCCVHRDNARPSLSSQDSFHFCKFFCLLPYPWHVRLGASLDLPSFLEVFCLNDQVPLNQTWSLWLELQTECCILSLHEGSLIGFDSPVQGSFWCKGCTKICKSHVRISQL